MQVCLPASALHALQFKGAMDHRGAMFFELTTREVCRAAAAAAGVWTCAYTLFCVRSNSRD